MNSDGSEQTQDRTGQVMGNFLNWAWMDMGSTFGWISIIFLFVFGDDLLRLLFAFLFANGRCLHTYPLLVFFRERDLCFVLVSGLVYI